MSDFPGFVLTKHGQNLLAKLQAGGLLTFTRVGTGSGRMPPANSVFSAVAAAAAVTITNSEAGASGAADVNTGFTVQIATPGSAGVHQVATVQCLAADQIAGGDYFTLSSPYLLFHVWFAVDGVGVDPAPAGSIGIKVDLAASNTAIAVAATLATTLDSHRLDLTDLCSLITEQQTLAVQSITRPDPAVSEIAVVLTNSGLATGYDLCELGVFATDPDLGEILYSVTNAGDQGDYFPSDGGATLIEAELRLRSIIAANAELSMEIMAGAYAGLVQFVEHKNENATEGTPGHAQFATGAETLAGLLTSKAVHPAGVKALIDALLDGTPGALDTLNELAAALGDDANYAATMITALAGKAAKAGDATQIFRVAEAVGESDAAPLAQVQALIAALPGKNKIINGNFDIWQRGTVANLGNGGTMVFGPDRWKAWSNGTGMVGTISRQTFALGQTDVPSNPTYFCRVDITTPAISQSYNVVAQFIESALTFAGQPVAISFWAKASADINLPGIELQQHFGSGGAPSAMTDNILVTNLSLTPVWQKFTYITTLASIAGKSLGTNNDSALILQLGLPVNAMSTVDIAQVQVEAGNVVTEFEQRHIAEELALCQRYYEKSYIDNSYPGIADQSGDYEFYTQLASQIDHPLLNARFAVRKRVVPAITWYSIGTGAAGKIRNITASTDLAVTQNSRSSQGQTGYPSTATVTGAGTWLGAHWVADSEL